MLLIDTTSIGRKYERDIDLLLAEEFAVSPQFAQWFLTQTKSFRDTRAEIKSVAVSKSDATGESDIVVVYKAVEDGTLFAVLIEDKVNAIFQPQQLERYRLRVAHELAGTNPSYLRADVIVCAPQNYADAHSPEIKAFDALISYESIATFFRDRSDESPRNAYRAAFIETACDTHATSNLTVYDDITDKFWDAVFKVANRDFPELEMKSSKYAKGTVWVTCRPRGMPSLPKAVKVELKGAAGFVDLTFNNTLCREMQPLIKSILDDDMFVEQTGAATSIRLRVDPFSVCENFEDMRKPVEKTLAAGGRLVRYFFKHQAKLTDAAAQATPIT